MNAAELQPLSASRQGTLRDFLTVLFRRKWLVLILPLVALVAVVVANFSQPPQYSSSTRILLKRGARENGLEPGVTILPREEELASQVEIAKSVAVINRAQQLLDRRPGRHYEINPGAATAGVVGESNVVDLTYESSDPQACPAVADALAQAFMEFHRRAFSIPSMAGFFRKQSDSLETALRGWRQLKESLLTNGNFVEPLEAKRNVLQLMLQQQTALDQIQTRRVAAEAEIQSQKALTGSPDLDLPYMPSTQIGSETWVVDLKRQLQDLRIKHEELRARYPDDNPQVEMLRDQITEVEAHLKRETRAHDVLERGQLNVLRAQENKLSRSVSDLNSQLVRYPTDQVRLEEIDNMVQLTQELYKQTRERQEQSLTAGATMPDWTATLLVPASVALRLNKHDYVRIALAPLLALAVSIGLAFFMDSLDHSLKSVREVEDILGLPVVASVPEVK